MENFEVERDIVFFDLETTGVDVEADRIVQIAAVQIDAFGKRTELVAYVNPEMPIPAEATEVHGITNDMVKDMPPFKDIARRVSGFFSGCDLAGYNIMAFDLPMLLNELSRCGLSLDLNVSFVDAMQIFYEMEPRTLEGALRFYCEKEHEKAHDALADVDATIAVLEGQLARYPDMPRTASGIWNDIRDPDAVDLAGKLRWNDDGEMVLNFGKSKGQPLRTVERSYLSWMMKNNVIGPDASNVIGDALRGKFYKRDR